MAQLEFHPFANLFPLLRDVDVKQWGNFLDSITTDGLLDPIVLYEDKILDGRNRYIACGIREVEPRFVEFTTLGLDVSALDYAFDRNFHRRDLSEDQRTAIWGEYLKMDAEFAKQRKKANLIPGAVHKRKSFDPTKSSDRTKNDTGKDTRQKLAEAAQVSEYKAQQLLNVQRDAPELVDDVKRGKLTLVKANDIAKDKAPANKSKRKQPARNTALKRAVADLCVFIEQNIADAVLVIPEKDRAFVASSLEVFAAKLRETLPTWKVGA